MAWKSQFFIRQKKTFNYIVVLTILPKAAKTIVFKRQHTTWPKMIVQRKIYINLLAMASQILTHPL